MNVREYTQGNSTRSVEELKKVIINNSDAEIDQVLTNISNCIDNIEDSEIQLESFFNIYEACEFKTI